MADYRRHTIRYGETLQSIAQQHYSDVNEWHTIREYNHLKYPYIVKDNQLKVDNPESYVMVGDTITIPIEQDILDRDVDTFNYRERKQVLDLVLGKDIQLFEPREGMGTYDEIFDVGSTARGDIAVAKGIDNLKQATVNRLLTPKGSLLLHPDYGSELHLLFGKSTRAVGEMIKNEITSVILEDNRISRVDTVVSKIVDDTYYGDFTIYIRSLEENFNILVEQAPDGNYVLR